MKKSYSRLPTEWFKNEIELSGRSFLNDPLVNKKDTNDLSDPFLRYYNWKLCIFKLMFTLYLWLCMLKTRNEDCVHGQLSTKEVSNLQIDVCLFEDCLGNIDNEISLDPSVHV